MISCHVGAGLLASPLAPVKMKVLAAVLPLAVTDTCAVAAPFTSVTVQGCWADMAVPFSVVLLSQLGILPPTVMVKTRCALTGVFSVSVTVQVSPSQR